MRILHPLSVLAGISAALLVVANGSFHGIASDGTAGWALAFAIVVFGAFIIQSPRSIEIALVPVVFGIPAIHFIWPLLGTTNQLILADAGDFSSYLNLGSWLTSHPISEAPHLGADYNALQFSLWDHVYHSLRPGGVFLLALFGSLSSREIAEIYSPFLAVALGLQALGVYLFALASFERLAAPACALIAILFTVSPAATWPAYASFLPQTIGIAFLLATVATFITVVNRFACLDRKDALILGCGFSLAAFATWSIYPESIPLGAAVCIFFILANYRQLSWLKIKRLVIFFGAALTFAAIVSPDSATWAARGFWIQMGTFAHGGPQLITAYTLLTTTLAASPLPLVESILQSTSPSVSLLSKVMLTLGLLGFLSVLFHQSIQIGRAVLLATLLLFIAVAIKYNSPPFTSYALWPTLFSWNLFKAAQYAAPFVATVALSGLLLSARTISKRFAFSIALLTTSIALALATGQNSQVWPRSYQTALDRDTIDFLHKLPSDGRFLISMSAQKNTDRYMIYTVLKERHFISTDDVQPPALSFLSQFREEILSKPISYVLSDEAGTIDGLPTLKAFGRFRLLDARNRTFYFQINGDRPALNLIATSNGLQITHP